MTAFLERRQRVTDTAGTLLFLEVSAPSFAETLRIVNDTQNWVSNGVEYLACPFGFKLPDDMSGQTPRAVLTLDNVGRGIAEDLERLLPGDVVMAKLMLSDRADPNVIERTYLLPLTQVSVNARTATAQCGYDAIMRQQAVRLRYNPFTAPGAF
ncbi:DUF1833 family protein [Stenotrophomonas nitritireducens]|uniref:DUF1833 domain-containing protein n=1 Tax=Stenotrophomonas nitritireducens TaxID=83617 RepID=A0ABR5NFF7_9GAMM|nr:DUF1833 family protein [Stenotrophomonas nitritireducens]KRG53615.1 hypothetical protein ABB22_17395 [Stenotrophomonas nitritireducens]